MKTCSFQFPYSQGCLVQSDKWIIPRNPIVDVLLSSNILGYEWFLSWIPEMLLRRFFYRDLKDLAPPTNSLFTSTPMVNDKVLDQIRDGTAKWHRCDVLDFQSKAVNINKRAQGVPKDGPGRHESVETDILIMATGYKRPSLSFLPDKFFEDPYAPPNWYIQTFPVGEYSIVATNSTYLNAIGTVGHFHIGVYTRLLLVFLWDPLTRPPPGWMKFQVDFTKWIKQRSPTGAFDFFSYFELCWWFVEILLFNPFRIKWILFVLFGWAQVPAEWITERERGLLEVTGIKEGPW